MEAPIEARTPQPPPPSPADRLSAAAVRGSPRGHFPYRLLLALSVGIAALVILVRPVLVADPCERANPAEGCSERGTGGVPVPLRGEAFVVGDSLTVGTEPFIEDALMAQGWRLAEVDAEVGRRVEKGLEILEHAADTLPPTVLVALGTNNLSATSEEVEGWLREARAIVGGRRLIWVDLCLDDSIAPRLATFREINETLLAAAGRYGVEVAHWCTFAEAHGLSTSSDGIHYDPDSYRLRAQFYGEALSSGLPVRAVRIFNDPVTGPR